MDHALPPTIVAAQLTDLSVLAVLLFVVNLLVNAVIAVLGWSLRRQVQTADDAARSRDQRVDRLAAKADEDRKALDARLEKLASAIEAEREARHQFHRELDGRVWGLNADLKENYELRRDSMRQYGTLVQAINHNQQQILDRIDSLPCKTAACGKENP